MKKNIISLVVLILAFISCTTQKHFSFNSGGSAQNFYYTTIPFEWVKNKIIVPVEINGKTYRFILDTGATNLVSETLCRELKLAVLHKGLMVDQSGKKDSALIVNMDSLALGGVLFRNIPAGVISDSNPFFQCFEIDGFIGSNMLQASIIRFSLPDKNITLTDNLGNIELNKKYSGKLWLSPNQSLPFFWIDLESGKKGREQLLFDSGMDELYDLSLENYYNVFQKRNIFNEMGKSFGSNSVGLHGNAENAHHHKLLLPLMQLNGMWLRNLVVQTTASSNSRIGAKILEYAIVTLDYRNKRIYFEPLFEKEKKDVYKKTFPVYPTFKENKLYVGFVWDDALKEVISVGDRILFIDEEDYRNIEQCEMYKKPSGLSDKEKVTFTIQKPDGSIHKIEIEKK